MPVRVNECRRRESAAAAGEIVAPALQPGEGRIGRLPEFLGANPVRMGLEGEAVGIRPGV
jgi:hypothetical protein